MPPLKNPFLPIEYLYALLLHFVLKVFFSNFATQTKPNWKFVGIVKFIS